MSASTDYSSSASENDISTGDDRRGRSPEADGAEEPTPTLLRRQQEQPAGRPSNATTVSNAGRPHGRLLDLLCTDDRWDGSE